MASKFKRGDCWYLDWRDETGARCKKSVGPVTEEQAEIALKAKVVELATGRSVFGQIARKTRAPLYEDFAVDYLTWYERQFPSSYKRTESILKTMMPWCRGKRLDEITADVAKEILRARLEGTVRRRGSPSAGAKRAKPLKATTVEKEWKTFRAVFERAVEWDKIAQHPFKHVHAPAPKQAKLPRFYTPAQLVKIYAVSRPCRKGEYDYAPLWQFVANTGLRRGEIKKARRADIFNGKDLNPLLPDRPVLRVESDPDDEHERADRNKSGKVRLIPLNAQALAALEHLGKDYLVPSMTKESLTRAFRRCVLLAGERGSIHWLRHTFGTNLVANGVPLPTVQQLLGHEDIATTMRYQHVMEGQMQDAVDRIAL